MVDVNNAKRVFKEYVSNYNLQDGKIALKVAHILRVSELSKKIATSLNLSEEDIKSITGVIESGLFMEYPIEVIH